MLRTVGIVVRGSNVSRDPHHEGDLAELRSTASAGSSVRSGS
jgi:hypothetical protein